VKLVEDYLKNIDWQVNENSNMSYSLQGLNNYIAEQITKVYWLNKIYPQKLERHIFQEIFIFMISAFSPSIVWGGICMTS